MSDSKRGVGRPKLSSKKKVENAEKSRKKSLVKRALLVSNISVPKEVRDELNVYRQSLSDSLGIDLTVAQALKYLIRHATVEGK